VRAMDQSFDPAVRREKRRCLLLKAWSNRMGGAERLQLLDDGLSQHLGRALAAAHLGRKAEQVVARRMPDRRRGPSGFARDNNGLTIGIAHLANYSVVVRSTRRPAWLPAL
jgi:hypothetical protein